MSFVTAAPEMLATAAQNVANIGTSLSAANATAAASTTSVLAAGADEVSQAIARLFSDYATHYQSLNAQAAAFHHSFVQTLNAAGGAYSSAEAANASAQALEQNLLAVINAPAQALFGRPLIGNGANGTAASPNGGDGGILYGNGGNGFSQTTGRGGRRAGGSAGLIGNGGNGHHVTPWTTTHRTDINDLTLACGPDNRLVEKGWKTRKNAHGDTEWLPPPHLDHGQPRINRYHHPAKILCEQDDDEPH